MTKNTRKNEKPMKPGRMVNGVQVIARAVDILWAIGRMGSVFSQRLPLPYNSQLLKDPYALCQLLWIFDWDFCYTFDQVTANFADLSLTSPSPDGLHLLYNRDGS
jgi:hypothetical protein